MLIRKRREARTTASDARLRSGELTPLPDATGYFFVPNCLLASFCLESHESA